MGTKKVEEPDIVRLQKAYKLRDENPLLAQEELEILSKAGSTLSNIYLGEMFEFGKGVEKNLSRAEFWFKKASDLGNPRGLYALATRLFWGTDFIRAVALYKQCIEKGYLPAYYRLANLYLKHEEENHGYFEEAIRLLENASVRGHAFSKRQLAGLMVKGRLGLKKRIPGLILLLNAVIGGMVEAARDPGSELLKR